MSDFLQWGVQGETALPQKMAAVLEGKAERRKAASFDSISATGYAPLLRAAGKAEVRQALCSGMAGQTLGARELRVVKCFLSVLGDESFGKLSKQKHPSSERPHEEQGFCKSESSKVDSDDY